MTAVRLRPAHTPERLAELYAKPHDSSKYVEHDVRITMTANLALGLIGDIKTVADLSCGDARITTLLDAEYTLLGDLAPSSEPYRVTGPLEKTLPSLGPVQLYVCTETLEHIERPEYILQLIRAKTQFLLLSTPVDAWSDTNEEHYWAWDRRDVEDMLIPAGFTPITYMALDFRPGGSDYCFGIWLCR